MSIPMSFFIITTIILLAMAFIRFHNNSWREKAKEVEDTVAAIFSAKLKERAEDATALSTDEADRLVAETFAKAHVEADKKWPNPMSNVRLGWLLALFAFIFVLAWGVDHWSGKKGSGFIKEIMSKKVQITTVNPENKVSIIIKKCKGNAPIEFKDADPAGIKLRLRAKRLYTWVFGKCYASPEINSCTVNDEVQFEALDSPPRFCKKLR